MRVSNESSSNRVAASLLASSSGILFDKLIVSIFHALPNGIGNIVCSVLLCKVLAKRKEFRLSEDCKIKLYHAHLRSLNFRRAPLKISDRFNGSANEHRS